VQGLTFYGRISRQKARLTAATDRMIESLLQ